jgi:fructosamine-3-kinase
MADALLTRALEARFCARVRRVDALSGGDINDAYRVELEGQGEVFVKANARAPAALFPAEARGLDWLGEAPTLRVPRVLGVSAPDEPIRYLVLEYLTPGRPRADFDERLGQGLAALHALGAARFGLDHDNYIGSLPQSNAASPTWVEFYRDRRLLPQLERASASGRASYALRRGFERLFEKLPELVGPAERPARLHGDLWGGNLHVDTSGAPCLIDPAAYAGHREMDLAMMRLFGGFSERVFAAYDEAWPLAAGARERVSLYQLYPLMVHVNLFGGSYVASVERALQKYVGG